MSEISEAQREAIQKATSKAAGHVLERGAESGGYLVFQNEHDATAFKDAVGAEGPLTMNVRRTSHGTTYVRYEIPSTHPNLALRDLVQSVIAEEQIPEKTVHYEKRG